MPYENYADARDNAWKEVLQKIETDRGREELLKLIESMKSR